MPPLDKGNQPSELLCVHFLDGHEGRMEDISAAVLVESFVRVLPRKLDIWLHKPGQSLPVRDVPLCFLFYVLFYFTSFVEKTSKQSDTGMSFPEM